MAAHLPPHGQVNAIAKAVSRQRSPLGREPCAAGATFIYRIGLELGHAGIVPRARENVDGKRVR
jgi:hypothetical protein